MWSFLFDNINWILGIATVVIWGGVIVWFLWGPMMERWRAKLEDWARD